MNDEETLLLIDSYDKHMPDEIEGAREFYPFTAENLPMCEGGV